MKARSGRLGGRTPIFGSCLALMLAAVMLPCDAAPRSGVAPLAASPAQQARPKAPSAPVIKPYPVEKVIESGTLTYEVALVTGGPDGLALKLKPLSPAMRRFALLSLVWHGWGRDGLHTFFYLGDASMAPEILEALKEPGFAKQRRAFAQAVSLFGPIYPRVQYLRDTFFAEFKGGDQPSPFDSAFDKKLYALGTQFGTKAEYGAALARMAARSRELSGLIGKLRLAVPDDRRLAWFTEQLNAALGADASLDERRRRLAAWPPPQRIIYLLDAFNLEMLNGSVDQYFYNSAGDLAPETVTALREAGLEKHAAALQKCVEMFGAPYPADNAARRKGWFSGSNESVLAKLRSAAFEKATAEVDDGAIDAAMLKIALAAGILPK